MTETTEKQNIIYKFSFLRGIHQTRKNVARDSNTNMTSQSDMSQEIFPMPALLKDRIKIGGICYEVERPKFNCFKPVSFNCVCYKCVTANCAGMAYYKRTYTIRIECQGVVDFSCACPTLFSL